MKYRIKIFILSKYIKNMKKFIDNDINILKVEFINNFYNSIKKYLNQEKIII
jgi:hypothetical protein